MIDYSEVVRDARQGRLAQDDQRFQTLKRHAQQGVTAAQNALREIDEAGGAHGGSVNHLI